MTIPLASPCWALFLGDSRTDPSGDVGPGPQGTWPYLLGQISHYFAAPYAAGNWYNFARDGYTTDEVLGQLAASGEIESNAGAAAYAFVWIGINDLGPIGNRTPQATYANLQSIWSQLRARGYVVVAFLTGLANNWQATIAALDQLILSDQSRYDVLIRPAAAIPIQPWLDTGNAWYQADGVHPTINGNTRIAQAVAAAIDPGCSL